MHFAVIGSGPSGFYAAEALLRADANFRVDLLDRFPTPFGLVRAGVAPDHPKIKQVSLAFERIAQNPRLGFFGNVQVGRDVSVSELRGLYSAVILATGAQVDSRLDIPGDELPGSYGAAEFVGWYNGHPDHSHRVFDLSHESAVIVGHGNVATDICRMLTTPIEVLESTDIPTYALEALRQSRIRRVHIVGRRGPAQSKFTNVELRELGEIPGCRAVVEASSLELNEASQSELADPRGEVARKNVELFNSFLGNSTSSTPQGKSCHFHFLLTPLALHGNGHVERISLARNRLVGAPFHQVSERIADTAEFYCGAIFRCIGFRGVPLPEVPFDSERSVVPNHSGRVVDRAGVLSGLYATGWIKRGANGVIGTNRADSVATIKSLLEDLPQLDGATRLGGSALARLLTDRGVRTVSYDEWRALDKLEQSRGACKGKPREKFCSVDAMLRALDTSLPYK